MTQVLPLSPPADLAVLQKVARTLDSALSAWDRQFKADLAAKEASKKQKSPFDEIEERLMRSTALAAAASGTPEQVRDMLAKTRSKALRAAADGADTAPLEAMARQMEHLAEIAEQNRKLKKRSPSWQFGRDAEAALAIAATNRGYI